MLEDHATPTFHDYSRVRSGDDQAKNLLGEVSTGTPPWQQPMAWTGRIKVRTKIDTTIYVYSDYALFNRRGWAGSWRTMGFVAPPMAFPDQGDLAGRTRAHSMETMCARAPICQISIP